MKSKTRPAATAPTAPARTREWRLPLLLLAATCAAYLTSLGLGLAMDAVVLMQDSRLQAFTPANLGRILAGPYWHVNAGLGLYRPLATLSFLFNYAILGNGVSGPGYHAVNLLLHLLNAGLVFRLARRVLPSPWSAWFAAALWAVHPVGTDAVANVAGRADLLAAAAVLGGLAWYVHRSRETDAPWKTAAVLLPVAAAGVFSKESAAVLPGLMLLWDISFGAGKPEWRRRAPAYGAALGAIALYLAVRPAMPPMYIPTVDNAEVTAGFWTARLTALNVIGRYLLLLVWPHRLSSDYSYNQVPLARFSDPAAWAAPAVIAALLAVAIIRRRKDRVLFFAAGWFGISLLPASNLVILVGAIMAERFLYLPAVGFALAAAALGGRAAARCGAGRERIVAAAAAMVVAALAIRTAARNPDWNDNAALWTSNLAAAPGSFKVHKSIASELNRRDPRGSADEAARRLETAWAIVRDLPVRDRPESVATDLGVVYRVKGDRAGGPSSSEGREWYRKSLESLGQAREILRLRDPARPDGGAPELYRNLAKVQLELGDPKGALETALTGRKLEPRNPFYYDLIATVHSTRGDAEAAAATLLEQWLAGAADPNTAGRVRAIYELLPDNACAFEEGRLNPRCPRVRRDLCAAGVKAAGLLAGAGLASDAGALRARAIANYGCEASAFDAALPR